MKKEAQGRLQLAVVVERRQKVAPSTASECECSLLCSPPLQMVQRLFIRVLIMSKLREIALEGQFLVSEPQLL